MIEVSFLIVCGGIIMTAIVIYLMFGIGLAKVYMDEEKALSDHDYEGFEILLRIWMVLLWPYELGATVGKISINYRGRLAAR